MEILSNIFRQKLANPKNIAKVLLQLVAANSELQIFWSKIQLASHLLQLRAAASKSRLAD